MQLFSSDSVQRFDASFKPLCYQGWFKNITSIKRASEKTLVWCLLLRYHILTGFKIMSRILCPFKKTTKQIGNNLKQTNKHKETSPQPQDYSVSVLPEMLSHLHVTYTRGWSLWIYFCCDQKKWFKSSCFCKRSSFD